MNASDRTTPEPELEPDTYEEDEPLQDEDEPVNEEDEPLEDEDGGRGVSMREGPRTWVMVALTAIFVALYLGTLFGWIRVQGEVDDSLLRSLEPILFAIIGYYFGRVPSEKSENRLAQRADAEEAKRLRAERRETREQLRAERAATLMRSARVVLESAGPAVSGRQRQGPGEPDPAAVRQAIAAATKILT